MTAHKKRLEEHIKAIHNKEKNFACHMCNFSTSWSGTLSKHMWVVHQEGTGNTFTCENCGYSTRDKKLYKNHLMNLHNIGDYKPGKKQIFLREYSICCNHIMFYEHGKK